MGSPKDGGVNPRSVMEKAVGCPENWFIKVGSPLLLTPKYTGSVGWVTITGSRSSNIACGVGKFGDAASWNPNWIPSWAALRGLGPTPVTVPARQLVAPLQ